MGLGCVVRALEFRVLGFRVFGFAVLGLSVLGPVRAESLGFRVSRFRAQGLRH